MSMLMTRQSEKL